MNLIRATDRLTGIVASERVMTRGGRLVPMREWGKDAAPSFDPATYAFRWADVSALSTRPMGSVEVITKSGLCVRVSDKHPVLTPFGYRAAGTLSVGGDVATAKRLPPWQHTSQMSPKEGYFLGLLVGDGGLTRGVAFTKKDQELIDAVREGAERLGATFHVRKNDPITYDLVGIRGVRGSNPVLNLLREHGLAGKKSVEKFLPEGVLTARPQTAQSVLAGLLDTDGTISARTHRTISWSSGSERLVREIQHLLMRLGVRGVVSHKKSNFDTIGWNVNVYSAEQHRLVCDLLAPYMLLSRKRNPLLALADQELLEKRNVDTIPRTDRLHELILSEKARLIADWPKSQEDGHGRYNGAKLFRRSGRISRHVLRWLADDWKSVALKKEAETWIQWDRVMSVESTGVQGCRAFRVHDDGTPNLVCGGLVVGESLPD